MRTNVWHRGIPAILLSFFMVSAQTVSVPTQYTTIAEALQYGTNILVTANITENIVISNMNVSITGSDSTITITGKARITNSTVIFADINLAGTKGVSSSPVVVDYFSWQTPPPCPTPIPGGNGDTGCIAVNSTISINNGSIKGGAGGASGNAYVVNYEYPMYIPCALGNSGNTGIGLCASQYTTLDTINTDLGAVVLDSTSRIIPGTTKAEPSSFPGKEQIGLPPKFSSSGVITFTGRTDFTVCLYTLSGRLVCRNAVSGDRWVIPQLKRGTYLMEIIAGKEKFRGKFVTIN